MKIIRFFIRQPFMRYNLKYSRQHASALVANGIDVKARIPIF